MEEPMKKYLLNFKKKLMLLALLAGVSSASGMVHAPDQTEPVTISNKLFKHITTYKNAGTDDCPYITGFHYYKAKPITSFSGYYLSVIDKDCWVISPTDPANVHYGYILYKGKLVKRPKTFFPSSLNEENLKEVLASIVAFAKNELNTSLKNNTSVQFTGYVPSLRSKVTIKFNQKNKITSIFPCLDDMALDQIVDMEHFMEWLKCMRQRQACSDSLQYILIRAAEEGCTEAVQHILACGAKVNPSDKDGEDTALIGAVENGHIATVRFLLDRGAMVDYKDSGLSTALECAARKGNAHIVRLLLKYGANINCVNEHGLTALIYGVIEAIGSGSLEMLKLLLETGANINHKDNDGLTALLWAVKLGDSNFLSFNKPYQHNKLPVIKLLLEHGADFTITNNTGESAHDVAVRLGLGNDVIKLLSAPKASYTCNIS